MKYADMIQELNRLAKAGQHDTPRGRMLITTIRDIQLIANEVGRHHKTSKKERIAVVEARVPEADK